MTTIASIVLAAAGLCFLGRIALGPSLPDRVVALDGLIITIVASVILNATSRESARFLDVAVVVAFVGFVGTAAAARYIERRGR